MKSPNLDEVLSQQIVKNLFFLLRVLFEQYSQLRESEQAPAWAKAAVEKIIKQKEEGLKSKKAKRGELQVEDDEEEKDVEHDGEEKVDIVDTVDSQEGNGLNATEEEENDEAEGDAENKPFVSGLVSLIELVVRIAVRGQ